jgi:tetratricopeptide (TPR) repeat protein
LGNLAHNLENWTSAIVAYRRAIAQEPNESSHYLYLAHVYQHHLGNLSQAEDVWRAALRIDQNDSNAWHHLGTILKSTERTDEAIAAFERSAALYPTPSTLAALADFLLLDPKRREEGLQLASDAVGRVRWCVRISEQIEAAASGRASDGKG